VNGYIQDSEKVVSPMHSVLRKLLKNCSTKKRELNYEKGCEIE
jgi:hypothetical protein